MDVGGEAATALDSIKIGWETEQDRLKSSLVTQDAVEWGKRGALTLKHVAGVDISFVKGDDETACAALVVLSYPQLQVVYEEYRVIKLTQPYIAGFLAFREVPFLVELLQRLKERKPQFYPDVVLVDGNGVLHPRGFGLACHLGVLCDVATIGIGKTFFEVDGLKTKDVKAQFEQKCSKAGDVLPLTGVSGTCWGVALKPTAKIKKPVFISVGHKLALASCVDIVMALSKFRLPEPIRYADQQSREYLRKLGYNLASGDDK